MNEIYTVEYIEREAGLIILFFSPHVRKRKVNSRLFGFNEMDHRIMKRLGIR